MKKFPPLNFYKIEPTEKDMNEWKELNIDDLPSDIFVGDYEFKSGGKTCNTNRDSFWGDILIDLRNECTYHYRKRQEKQPSHEEIMTKWWKLSTQGSWCRVYEYREVDNIYHLSDDTFCNKQFFIGKESADIPPEGK